MTVLIFGAGGQDGHYLTRAFEAAGHEVLGVSRTPSTTSVVGDVGDFETVSKLVREHRVSHVVHLAAESTTRHAALFSNHQTIATGSLNVLEAVHRHASDARVFITGSGVQFENHGQAISEQTAFAAHSPYAIARIQSVYAARYYRTLGVNAYVGYLFHHESPLRGENHVSKLVANAVAEIAGGQRQTLELGDISVRKEWTFAGDVAEAIVLLMGQTDLNEAIIGSGKDYSIEQWLEACFGHVGRRWQDHVAVKSSFAAEYPRLVSDPRRINALGWQPQVDFAGLAEIMMVDALRTP